MIRDIALVKEIDGHLTVHSARCPVARDAAGAGQTVITMIGIQRAISREECRYHTCMDDGKPAT